jgi:subtilase family serine protease
MHTKANPLKVVSFSVLVSLVWLSEALFGQGALKDRVMQAVDTSQMTAVRGNVHPLARPEFDQGRVDPSMAMRVTTTFKMTAAQQADLDALLAAQQERGSPDFQRWLTPEQFGSRFGLSQVDLNKVTGWLESEGFQVENVPASRNMITFSGTARQVESALHTEMHRYVVNGKAHFANSSEPAVPAALADVVSGFRSMNNFQLKPRVLKKMSPRFTSGISGNHFITPKDFATIYNVAPLYQQGLHGEGQSIVVAGQSNINVNDVRAFRSNSGLPANDPQVVIVPRETDPGMVSTDIDEANLDVEWAGAIAYNATVIFVVGNQANGGVFDAIQYAITANLAPVMSTSYGDCEADFSSTDVSTIKAMMQQANAQGITVLGPSGDNGAADCDFNTNPNGPPITASTQGLAVDLPGALQSVTSVGGTAFTEGSDAAGVYWTNPQCLLLGTCSNLTVSQDVKPNSALSYVPEGAWNDTNVDLGKGMTTGLAAGGGGSSTVIPKPAWQTGMGVPNDGARDVPDLSFSASSLHDAYLICSENFANNTFTPTCVNGFRDSTNNLTPVGGTSVGPPAMAGIVALINQSTKAPGSGNINAVLYPLAARFPSAFHDIQSGSNKVPFSPPCVASTQIGYNALPGYDLATGLGSIDALRLVTNWTSVSPASTANATASVNFSLAFTQAQLTVKRGSCGSGTVTLTQLNGFMGTPTFTCTVPTTLGSTTCAVVPAVTGGFAPPGNYREVGWWGISGFLLAATAFILARMDRFKAHNNQLRVWPRFVPGFALVTLLGIMIGCGNSSKSAVVDPQLNYTFAVQVPSTAPVATGAISVNAAIGGINRTAQITVTTQ